jgi:radical SAM superfamily enzyme YgiQ (UPF0313 family)
VKVLLINPPDDLHLLLGEGAKLITPFEPLGLLYVASVAQGEGYDVSAIDAYVEGLDIEDIKKKIEDHQPDVVGLSSFTSNGGIVYEIGKWLKSEVPDVFVVLGNVHASIYAEQYLRNRCCDIVVHGEGEYSFLDILRTLEKRNKDFSSVPSVSFLKNGSFVTTEGKGFVADLNKLPLPSRDLVDQNRYNVLPVSNLPYARKKENTIGKHMFTSRGCPYRCTFCVVHHSRKQRQNDVVRVVDEMEMLVEKYRAEYIFIMDSLFISSKKRVLDICAEIRNRNLDFKWGCEAHVNFIDEELVKAMESAGCFDMAFGIESGVQRLLDNVRKGIKLGRVEEAIKTVKRHTGIKVSGLFILGLPGETYQDSLQTIRFAKKLPLDMAQFSNLVPYPGSPLFDEFRVRGEIDTGIREDGSLDPSVWLRYSAYISYTENDPIWVTPDLTPEMLKKLQKKALRNFYFRPKQFYYQMKRIRFSEIGSTIKLFFHTFFDM